MVVMIHLVAIFVTISRGIFLAYCIEILIIIIERVLFTGMKSVSISMRVATFVTIGMVATLGGMMIIMVDSIIVTVLVITVVVVSIAMIMFSIVASITAIGVVIIFLSIVLLAVA
jgi:hypothetical protein